MKKILSVLFLIIILLPGSAFHTMLLLMLLAWLWHKEIKQYAYRTGRYLYGTLWGILWSLTLLLMPRPFALPTDRMQMVHFNDKGEIVSAPISHWIFNLISPEETLCALGSVAPLTPLRYIIPAGNSIMNDYYHELRTGGLLKIGKAYHNLDAALESPMSAAITQAFYQHLGDKHRSAYIIRPKHFDSEREYPVLFFAHGLLGNWKMYAGILRNIDNHIIVYMGTEDYSGIFGNRHIKEIKNLYLPMLKERGYKINEKAISLMGLSNGGSAVDVAYSKYASEFKNLIYVSTGVNYTHHTSAKIMVIGGGKDHCAPSM